MRPLLLIGIMILTSVLVLPTGGAEAARLRVKKSSAERKQKTRSPGDLAKRGPGSRRGLSAIFARNRAGKQTGEAASHRTVRQRLARTASKVKRAVTFDRFISAQIGLMKFGSTLTLGAALATGRPSVIVMAGVMTAGAFALRPLMGLGERLGERLAARMDRRGG
jgi:hypothetical protein